MTISLLVSAVLSVLTPVGPRNYESCTSIIELDPEGGLDYAEAWQGEGGGAQARHCTAIALIALDKPASAGAILARLAEEEVFDPGVSARLYLQAAEALMSGGRKEAAFRALRGAYEKAPDTPEVHMSAAVIYATAEEWEGVILTLDALARFADLSSDAFALRGRAKFELERYVEASRDVSDALALDPYLVDAIVLRGDLLNEGISIPNDPFTAPKE
ncbi:tetratricopeptide repeat protein [Parvularcula marina]|uniref:Uncharacterized protein n=1 Tax=Parvularcula marina TaxID=2292771 RepID=A0A371RK20_9PROT|nr:hypothetical protein [Parvularcula marina]RFB05790.1 hypothetical protein DX908_11240 [Parvularcula marina]